MIDIQKAAVYCGTYKKYNEGSLEGAWIRLNNYPTWEDFNKKCCEIHKDEAEPEFMFQDAQYLPTEFFTEHWVYSEIFQVLSEIRNWSEDKLKALDDWCEDTAAIPDMYDIETFEEFYAKTKKTTDIDADFAEFSNIVESKYKVYTKKDFVGAIKIAPDKFITFDKDIFSLKKSFCWGWSSFDYGYEYDEANKLCDNFNEEDFKKANLTEFDKKILSEEELRTIIKDWNGLLVDEAFCSGERKPYEFYIIHPRTYRDACMYNKIKENPLVINAKFMQVYLNKVAKLRAKFEKKIDNYLKKYGVSKIKKWTYCSDD